MKGEQRTARGVKTKRGTLEGEERRLYARAGSSAATSDGAAYVLDNVYDSSSRTRDVYDGTTRGIIESVVGGFNGTVFAYGQTSSGKTHTMQVGSGIKSWLHRPHWLSSTGVLTAKQRGEKCPTLSGLRYWLHGPSYWLSSIEPCFDAQQ
jgi:hypothetical protein